MILNSFYDVGTEKGFMSRKREKYIILNDF
jgi:hypothetical protein